MIKIIKKGEIPKGKYKDFKKECSYCHTIFSYDDWDVTANDGIGCMLIKCPLCLISIPHTSIEDLLNK